MTGPSVATASPIVARQRIADYLIELPHQRLGGDAYSVELLGLKRGAFRASSGLRVYADCRAWFDRACTKTPPRMSH